MRFNDNGARQSSNRIDYNTAYQRGNVCNHEVLQEAFGGDIVLSRSRSTWLGLTMTTFFLLLFSPLKRYAILVGIIALVDILSSQFAKEIFSQRVGSAGEPATQRFGNWRAIITNPSPYIILCGRGAIAEIVRLNATPHNAYFTHSVLGWFLRGALGNMVLPRIVQNSVFSLKNIMIYKPKLSVTGSYIL